MESELEGGLEALGRLIGGLIDPFPEWGLIVVDDELRVRSSAGELLSAGAEPDPTGRPLQELTPLAVWEQVEVYFRAALAGHPQRFEHPGRDEHSLYCVRILPIGTAEKEAEGLLTLIEDVSLRAAVERATTKSEALQHSILGALEEGVVVLGDDGHLVQANRAAIRLLGADPATAADGPAWWGSLLLRSPGLGDGRTGESPWAFVRRTGEPLSDVELEVVSKDGRELGLLANFRPLSKEIDEDGGLVVSFREITTAERERVRLRHSESQLRMAQEISGLTRWRWEPGSDEVSLMRALPAGEGADHRLPLSRAISHLPEQDSELAGELLDELTSGGKEEVSAVHRWRSADGSVRWIESRARGVRDEGGAVVAVLGTSQDVSEREESRREAARLRDFFEGALDSIPANLAILDEHAEIIKTNSAWDRFALANGGGGSCGVGANYLTACEAGEGDPGAAQAADGLRRMMAGSEDELILEYPCHSPEVERWFELRAAPYRGHGAVRIIVQHIDRTERHRAIREASERAQLLDEVDVAVIATDEQLVVTHWNRGANKLYGWTREEALGRKITELTAAGQDTEQVAEIIEAIERDGSWEGEFRVSRKDGTSFDAYVRNAAMCNERGQISGVIGVSVDMSERIEIERELRSTRDYLAAVARSMGEGMCTLDDEDRVVFLNEAAERLLGWKSDQLHGELLRDVVNYCRPDGSTASPEQDPVRLARRQERTIRVDDDIFVCRDGTHLPVEYTAAPLKTDEGVRGCVVVFTDISERKQRERQMRTELESLSWGGRIVEALERDQFLLHAQPIVDLGSGETVQHELLIRMENSNGEPIPPGEFLPAAEASGLIGRIDRWVIGQVAELAGRGQAVEFNLSAQSLGDPKTYEVLERALDEASADPGLVVVELTETALLTSEEIGKKFVERAHALGCKIALDDFGTGYGGFTYIKHLPVDYLKIDIEFVRDLPRDRASQHVVSAVVNLAAGFGLQTVAEGVEDEETLELLKSCGVDCAQGYHLGKPAPLERTLLGASRSKE